MRRSLVGSVSVLFLVAVSLAAQEKKPEVRVERDLVFGKGGTVELKLDLAMPRDGDGPFPAIVCVHGGGWRQGSRDELTKTIEVLAGRGYVAVTVSYRLAPDARFPAQIEDCKAAVRWLRANAAKHKVDPERIGALGYSAGGHLVCLLGTTLKDDELEGQGGNPQQSSGVQAVVGFFPPTDLSAKDWGPDAEKTYFVPLLGGTRDDKADLYRKASPITYVRKGAPPFLLLHGTEDKLVPISQSRALAEKLRGVGATVKLVEVEGAGHGWGGTKLTETVQQAVSFLDEHLKTRKPK